MARGGRHVILTKELAKNLPKARLLNETEWRGIGVQQSRGWQHYAIHRWRPSPFPSPPCMARALPPSALLMRRLGPPSTGAVCVPARSSRSVGGLLTALPPARPPASRRPEPHILLFRRPLGTDPVTGKVDPELEREAKEAYQRSLEQNQTH